MGFIRIWDTSLLSALPAGPDLEKLWSPLISERVYSYEGSTGYTELEPFFHKFVKTLQGFF